MEISLDVRMIPVQMQDGSGGVSGLSEHGSHWPIEGLSNSNQLVPRLKRVNSVRWTWRETEKDEMGKSKIKNGSRRDGTERTVRKSLRRMICMTRPVDLAAIAIGAVWSEGVELELWGGADMNRTKCEMETRETRLQKSEIGAEFHGISQKRDQRYPRPLAIHNEDSDYSAARFQRSHNKQVIVDMFI